MVKKVALIIIMLVLISCKTNIEFRKNVASFLIPKPLELSQTEGFFNIDKNISYETIEILCLNLYQWSVSALDYC